MRVTAINSYLVHPGKNEVKPLHCLGATLPLSGPLFEKLSEVFHRSEMECNVSIRFVIDNDGTPQNPVRSSIIAYLRSPTFENGIILANRLRDNTTRKPGLGLFFLISGRYHNEHKILLSRFPAEQGILAVEKRKVLKIEYIEQIFMKNALSYKAAVYKGTSFDSHFWSGHAIDKQFEYNQLADYWIRGFLSSDFKTTSKTGTRRLALALKTASQRVVSLEVKQELVAAITIAKNMFGRLTSVGQFIDRLGLSRDARTIILGELPNEQVLDDTFILDRDEFLSNAPLKSVELDTGPILIAPAERFDELIQREQISKQLNNYRFTTEGKIVDERLRGKK